MIPVHAFPTLNASLNAASAICLLVGFALVRRKRLTAHGWAMSTAMGVAAVFFVCYAVYHAQVGSVKFQGVGWIRPVYFGILISHTVLAVVIVPLAIRTVWLAARGRIETHKRWARVTFPLWLYVSVTGVLVYLMLYHWT
jgi:uncharacterized membrane protein YozB (DUF420 family)